MSFTLATLKTAIQDYTENTETTFVNNLPLFIRAAEERILKSVQLSFFRKNVTANFSASDQFLAIPSDFLAPFSLSFTDSSSNKNFLDFKDVNFLQEFTPNAATTGTPRYYAVFDVSNFIIAPTPASALAVELHYYYRPGSLTTGGDSGTTWLSENAELALLYGSLYEAYTFMKGEADVLQNYNARLVEAISTLKMLGEAKEVTHEYRAGKVIRQKQ
ncbi:MAG: hypothetical protein CMF74_05225 [Maricaulis sp.]|jgi:hypothetical protein|nr:hypothetical protein [Maricaulis sp.]|tara:strand:+ start:336 stop:986 length:651 start_codon:yes stop_codon:yes gene_type:complete